VSGLDSDNVFFAKTPCDYEMALELTYQAPIVPGWIIQPDFQYIFHPRYGAIDSINPAVGRIPDAAVLGIRTAVKF
jgi:porin